MANTSLQARLKRLFSNQVVVRRVGKNLKVLDTNRLQSQGNPTQTRYIDRYAGVHSTRAYLSGVYNQSYNFYASKLELFGDYEAMDLDPILASALDIYADECTVRNPEGDLLTIKTSNDKIRKILYNLFYDILNIEYNLWPWIRNTVKYGDMFLALDIEDEIGIVNVTPLSAYEVRREEAYDESNPYSVRFVIEGSSNYQTGVRQDKTTLESYQVAHFRLLSDTNFLPYGKSMIEGARKFFKMLTLMEDAMLLHRVMRAPERRIFKIDIGNIPPTEVDQHIQNIITKTKKIPLMDENTGQYNLRFNLQNMLEDYYMPVRGGDSGTSIDTLPGLSNEGSIEDIEYLRNKMMAALKIPKAFLGYDENVEGKSTLAAEDVRFARTIERVQRIIVSELTKIAVIHLYAQGFENEDLVSFELHLTSPSIVYERQKIEIMKEKMDLANSMRESNLFSVPYIYENLFGMSEDQWNNEQDLVIEDLKNAFRYEQIKSEGNDPKKTNMSFGTPHDIASMHVGTKLGLEQEHVPGTGRPKDPTNFGKQRDQYGRDPFGGKDLTKTFSLDTGTSSKPRGGSPLALDHYSPDTKRMMKQLEGLKVKSKSVLAESLASDVDKDPDSGTFMDETNLKDLGI